MIFNVKTTEFTHTNNEYFNSLIAVNSFLCSLVSYFVLCFLTSFYFLYMLLLSSECFHPLQ